MFDRDAINTTCLTFVQHLECHLNLSHSESMAQKIIHIRAEVIQLHLLGNTVKMTMVEFRVDLRSS